MNRLLLPFSFSIRQLLRSATALLLFASVCMPAFAATTSAEFETANDLYEQQKFAEAAGAYEKLIENGTVTATILFNLGNARFQTGEFGKAIAAYRQAQKLSPRDPDIRANLRFARDKVQNTGSIVPRESWFSRLSTNEWTVLAVVPLWICFLLLAFGELRRDWQKVVRSYAIIPGVLTVIIGICAAFAMERELNRSAVVITEEAVVRHGPFNESQSAFTLRRGAELNVLDERENWVQISAGPNRLGWIPKNRVTVIN